ncbi:hypothetical protein OIU76_016453 [Salix suchowensis]|nr:hypothetical protein OIU76_016453 [Salix suchowensis]KAJ6384066.1 hypothetical protein OIU78_027383 [Salix suchowensis]
MATSPFWLCSQAAWLLSDIGDNVLWMATSAVGRFDLVMESSHLDHHPEIIWILIQLPSLFDSASCWPRMEQIVKMNFNGVYHHSKLKMPRRGSWLHRGVLH